MPKSGVHLQWKTWGRKTTPFSRCSSGTSLSLGAHPMTKILYLKGNSFLKMFISDKCKSRGPPQDLNPIPKGISFLKVFISDTTKSHLDQRCDEGGWNLLWIKTHHPRGHTPRGHVGHGPCSITSRAQGIEVSTAGPGV